ncbi:MAG: glycosyltransferase family 2 protein, partial [Rikenellaceae bacterium]
SYMILEELHHNPKVGAVAPKLRSLCEPTKFEYAGAAGGYIDALGYPFCRGRIMQHTEEDKGQYDDKRDLFWVSGAAFGCRAELFHTLGGFDTDMFAHMEEIDLCWRMQLRGFSVRYIPTSTVYHLGGGTLQKSSPQKIYLNHRNNLVMLFKCAPTAMRITVALVRPPLDMAAALSYLLKGDFKGAYAVLRAYAIFIKWHPRLLAKRREVRDHHTAESQYIYRGSIIMRYLFRSRNFDNLM